MLEKEFGFTLKRIAPDQHKISIITPSYGKITLYVKKASLYHRLWPAMLITFVPSRITQHHCVTNQIEIIHTFWVNNKEDLYWIHHLLELYYYFIMPANPSSEIFLHLRTYLLLLTHRTVFDHNINLVQRLCILHFLHKTGFYSMQEMNNYQPLLRSLDTLLFSTNKPQHIHRLLQQIQEKEISDNDAKKIDNYLYRCLQNHPSFAYFKTTRFIYST